MQGWARLDVAQRQRFFEASLKAALRLDRLELRAWLRRRLQNPPLAARLERCPDGFRRGAQSPWLRPRPTD